MVCKIVSKKPFDGIEWTYERDKYTQTFSEIENLYKMHAETNLLKPFIDFWEITTDSKFLYLICPNKSVKYHLNQLD